MAGGWHSRVAWCVAALCAGGCARGPAPRYRKLSEAVVSQITGYDRLAAPWEYATPEEVLLRRRVYDLEEELLGLGHEVRSRTQEYWTGEHGEKRPERHADVERLRKALRLTLGGPRRFVCGEEMAVQVTLANLTDKKLRLLIWDGSFQTDLVHPSGCRPRRTPPLRMRIAERAIQVPGPEDYVTLGPGEGTTRTVPLRYVWPEPGRYHLTVSYVLTGSQLAEQLGLRTYPPPVHSQVVPVELVLGSNVGGLECSLESTQAQIEPGKPLVFTARLRDGSKGGCLLAHPSVGGRSALGFRDPEGGVWRWVEAAVRPSPVIEPDGWPPYYLRQGHYVYLAPGQALEVSLMVSLEALPRLGDLLRPGRPIEVVWQYSNHRTWYLERGEVSLCGAWIGRLGSPPLRLVVGRPQ